MQPGKRERKAQLDFSLSFTPRPQSAWMVSPTFKVGLPTSVKLLRKCPPRHIQRCVSMVSLHPIKFARKVNHHNTLLDEFCLKGGRRGWKERNWEAMGLP